MRTLLSLADDLAQGRTTSRALVEECLANADDPAGEGRRVFLKVDAEGARNEAARQDELRYAGRAASAFAGIPISIKDLFDREGEVTRAGSTLLRDAAPATRDAIGVQRLRAAGFIVVGRTNMTEFAFSGLGLNSHYGTPANPFDRATRRIPGGSSCGAAVSITDGMSFAALGTDTGGSCRIPAALCGIVGFKPTARRVPLDGAFPLSPSLDSIGPLARSVECCGIVDAILANEPIEPLRVADLSALRFAIPQSLMLDEMDAHVAASFARALRTLASHGADIVELELPELLELPTLNRKGGLAPPEAYAIHRAWITERAHEYDPRVLARILRGKEQDAADYIQLLQARIRFIARLSEALSGFDAMLSPTLPIVAPPIASLADDETYGRINMLALRNPSVVNFIDGCAISIPCHREGEAPVGLMIASTAGNDRKVLSIARSAEIVNRRLSTV